MTNFPGITEQALFALLIVCPETMEPKVVRDRLLASGVVVQEVVVLGTEKFVAGQGEWMAALVPLVVGHEAKVRIMDGELVMRHSRGSERKSAVTALSESEAATAVWDDEEDPQWVTERGGL